ncbi:MAG: hypothetical protein ACUVSB_01275 [Anaerolineae bacterium]
MLKTIGGFGALAAEDSLCYRRFILCGWVSYSSEIIAFGEDARNLNRFRVFAVLRDLLGDRPRVLDLFFKALRNGAYKDFKSELEAKSGNK